MAKIIFMEKTLIQFDDVIKTSRDIFKIKLKNYGSSWRILRLSSIIDHIFIKVKRIRNIQEKGFSKIDEESSEDFLAIINYSIIGLIQLNKNYTLNSNISYEESLIYYDTEIKKAKNLMELKNHDYNEVWKEIKLSSIIDIILQKLLRMKNIENNQNKIISKLSMLEETYLDILIYSVFSFIKIYK